MVLFYFIAENYHEYFTTPYFIFARDTLSYLTLLGLHFALCLSPSVIPFSGLERVILVFFMGRVLMESKQFRNVKVDQGRDIVIKKKTGNKYTRCSENEEPGAQIEICGENVEGEEDEQSCSRISRSTMFARKCGKYLRYCGNFFFFLKNFICNTWSASVDKTPGGDSHMKSPGCS